MTTKRLFKCKSEELPVIGEFLLSSLRKDLADFSSFSPVFTESYIQSVEVKISTCKELISSSTVTGELKAVTGKISDSTSRLRVKLNILEGYLKLGAAELDIAIADAGVKGVRSAISRGNIEGVTANTRKLLTAIKRNSPALEAKGMNPALPVDIETQIQEIDALNVRQNELLGTRNRLTGENIELFNDLWTSLHPILETAKALYRGVNQTGLNDYTIARLRKRINAEGKRAEKVSAESNQY
jgi:hypothetical protein